MKEYIEIYSIEDEPKVLSVTDVTALKDDDKAETLALLQSGSTLKLDNAGNLVPDIKTPIIKTPTKTLHHVCYHDTGGNPCEVTEV